MKISVIVPVYNSEKHLRQCLDSLTGQTFKDMEIICVNDGSTDNSQKILEEYQDIVVIHQENQGVSAARNAGMRVASGEYIGFVDSDDWVDSDYFEKLYYAVLENGCDAACASIIRKREITEKYRVRYTAENVFCSLDDMVEVCKIPECCYVWNKLYKAEKIKGIDFREGVFFEDMVWTPQALLRLDSIVTVSGVNYYYRANPDSIVKLIPSVKKQEDFYNAYKELVDFFERNNIQLAEKDKVVTRFKWYFFRVLVLKIKEYRFTRIFYLLGFLPCCRVTRYPELEGENG